MADYKSFRNLVAQANLKKNGYQTDFENEAHAVLLELRDHLHIPEGRLEVGHRGPDNLFVGAVWPKLSKNHEATVVYRIIFDAVPAAQEDCVFNIEVRFSTTRHGMFAAVGNEPQVHIKGGGNPGYTLVIHQISELINRWIRELDEANVLKSA